MERERVRGSPFGALLRSHRLRAGLTQEALAERARMSAVGIGSLERGSREAPYRETVELLARALGLSADDAAGLRAAAVRPARPRTTSQRAPIRASEPQHNLPLTPTPFLGRVRELAELHALLGKERLITLAGTGGIGKTRTALEASAEFVESKKDGVWFVTFAALSDPTLVAGSVATALGVKISSRLPVMETLLAALRRRDTLIVLDNCEHVVGAAAELAHAIVMTCPRVTLLVTSREPLNVAGERVYRLPSLDLPPDGVTRASDGLQYAAVALFAGQATAADSRFALSDANVPAVADIVRRLDGIPLAIELAAARVGTLAVAALAQRLDARFALLTGGSRTALPRQRTLRAAFDWSYELLSEAERTMFARVAIFAGGWTLEAAEAVCGDASLQAPEILDLVASLVEKSLVVADDNGMGLRYRLLESSRAYALEKTASDARPELARRHARWVQAFVEHADERVWNVVLQDWLASIEPEIDNVRAALTWAVEAGDYLYAADIVAKLDRYWYERAGAEGQRWIDAVAPHLDERTHPTLVARLLLASASLSNAKRMVECAERAINLLGASGEPRLRAWAYSRLATGFFETGRLAEAEVTANRTLELYDAAGLGHTRRFAATLVVEAMILMAQNRLDDARRSCAAGLSLSESLGDDDSIAWTRISLAEVEFNAGNTSLALELVQRVKNSPGLSLRAEATALSNMAAYLLALGDAGGAQTAVRAVLPLLRRTDAHWMTVCALLHLAAALALDGDPHRAARLLGFADAWQERESFEWDATEAKSHNMAVASLRTQLSAIEFAELVAAGGRLDEDHAIREALADK